MSFFIHLNVLYFDHNASSPLCIPAREAWIDAASRFIGNPSSPHRLGSRAEAALAAAREKLASWLGCDSAEIVWTSGATESNNTVVNHFASTSEGEAWISAIEHPSVLEAVRHWFAGRFKLIPVNHAGQVEAGWLKEELARVKPAFIGVMAANNETGVLQPCNEIAALCMEKEVPFFLRCRAVDWQDAFIKLRAMRFFERMRPQIWRSSRRRIFEMPVSSSIPFSRRPSGKWTARRDREHCRDSFNDCVFGSANIVSHRQC